MFFSQVTPRLAQTDPSLQVTTLWAQTMHFVEYSSDKHLERSISKKQVPETMQCYLFTLDPNPSLYSYANELNQQASQMKFTRDLQLYGTP